MTQTSERLAEVVAQRIERLQKQYLTRNSYGIAMLANLRHAVGKLPGTIPAIWELTIDGIGGYTQGGAPSKEEMAVHDVFTLYAIHQQSKSEPMHIRNRLLGQAVRDLENSGHTETAVRRRFNAIITSSTYQELTYHLRGLISQFHSEGITLDYRVLVENLFLVQFAEFVPGVKMTWARSYYSNTQEQK